MIFFTWFSSSYYRRNSTCIQGGEGSGEFECASVEEFVVTFGTSCNYHTYLHNIVPTEAEYDDTMTPRSSGSPGIGAYSYYGGALFYASRDIEAGEEVFANYGEEWLDGRPYLSSIPREDDFEKAGEVISKLYASLDKDDIDGTCSKFHCFFFFDTCSL